MSADAVTQALEALDRRLASACDVLEAATGRSVNDASAPGLYVTVDDARALLAGGPLGPAFLGDSGTPLAPARAHPFATAARALGLDQFDLDLVVLALAPEVDARYARLFAFLQDDLTRTAPSVDLALTLLCTTAEERSRQLRRFQPGTVLTGGGVLETSGRGITRELRLDAQLLAFMMSAPALDPVLAGVGAQLGPTARLDELALEAAAAAEIERVTDVCVRRGAPLRLALSGANPALRRAAAGGAAARLSSPVLVVDALVLTGLPVTDATALSKRAERECRLRGWALLVENIDLLVEALSAPDATRIVSALATGGADLVTSTAARWAAPSAAAGGWPAFVQLELAGPDAAARARIWGRALRANDLETSPVALAEVAGRFELDEPHIVGAAGVLAARGEAPTAAALVAAARAQSAVPLSRSARRMPCPHGWPDLVLPEGAVLQLRELCAWVSGRTRVLDEWGFGTAVAPRGVTALFAGGSGTGKTMACGVIAREIGFELYRIDLAQVVSKYIGETEKNLDGIFNAAEGANAVLLFDEAEALFGKRTEVRDAHDRYANIEISYLLSRMEEHRGLTVLATNLARHLDAAFLRRLAFTVHFPFPAEAERGRIWASVLPPQVPLGDDVDLAQLARDFELSGGNIRNCAVAAAFFAAHEEAPLCQRHLTRAVRREYGKLGRSIPSHEALPATAGLAP
ncbi:MAG: ATPase [Solirubrobacterales bacterium]|nr:ATPase [Solirubrobacterales bacterium]